MEVIAIASTAGRAAATNLRRMRGRGSFRAASRRSAYYTPAHAFGASLRLLDIHAFTSRGDKEEPRSTLNSRAISETLGQFNLRSLLAAAFSVVF